MRLTNELFRIAQKREEGKAVAYDLTLNAGHFIYKAHFPGDPITPGVCIVQMAKELLEDSLATPLRVVAVKNVKFLNIISPTETPQVTCLLTVTQPLSQDNQAGCEDGLVSCTASVKAVDKVLTKISFTCQRERDA